MACFSDIPLLSWSLNVWFDCFVIVLLALGGWVQSNDHLCKHPDHKPYHIQAVTRTASHLYVIESDNLYKIPADQLQPNECRIRMSDDNGPMPCQKWYQLDWTSDYFLHQMRIGKPFELVDFLIYTEPYFSLLNLDYRYENEDSAYLQYVFPHVTFASFNRTISSPDQVGQFALSRRNVEAGNKTLVFDGITNQRGYFIEFHQENQRVTYSNLAHVIEANFKKRKSYQRYYLQITAYKRVKFVPMDLDPPSSKDLVVNRQPFGFIDKSGFYLLDVPTKSVYRLPFVELGTQQTAAGIQIQLQKKSLKTFFHCCKEDDKPDIEPEPDQNDYTVDPLKRTEKTLLIVVVVVVVCLCLAMLLVIYNVKFKEPKQNAQTILNQTSGGHGRYRILSMGEQLRMNNQQVRRSSGTSIHGGTTLDISARSRNGFYSATPTTIPTISKQSARFKHSSSTASSSSINRFNSIRSDSRNIHKSASSAAGAISATTTPLNDTSSISGFQSSQPKSKHLPIVQLKPLINQSMIGTKKIGISSFEFSVSNTNPSNPSVSTNRSSRDSSATLTKNSSRRNFSTQNSLSTATTNSIR